MAGAEVSFRDDAAVVTLRVLGAKGDEVGAGLRARVRGVVLDEVHERLLYATDASVYQVMPMAVVIPADVEDVVAAVRFAAAEGLPILARGAGTSLAGQTVNRAMVIDFSTHCQGFLEFDGEARTCRVEPGLVLDDLNREVAARSGESLMFGPDVATSAHANVGGMMGNNSAGAHSVLYGRTVAHVRAIKAVLMDGAVVDFSEGAASESERVFELTAALAKIVLPIGEVIDAEYGNLARGEGGYNLPLLLRQLRASSTGTFDRVNLGQFLVGSEGTLALTLEAELGLVAKPRVVGLAVLSFGTLEEALLLVPRILAGTKPSAVELLDDVIVELAGGSLATRDFVKHLPDVGADVREGEGELAAVLYVEYFGESDEELEGKFAALQGLVDGDDVGVAWHVDGEAMAEAWQLRKAAEPLVHAIPGLRKPIGFVEDTAVAPEDLPKFIERFRAIVAGYGSRASYYAHASVGCLHVRPLLNLADASDRAAMEGMAREVAKLVAEFGGSFSGEHGLGRARSAILGARFSPTILRAFAEIKDLFDPEGRLNPGNIVKPAGITEDLRLLPAGRDEPLQVSGVETFFDYEDEGGFAHAMERCNGAGICRREQGGVMCPSFRATREERHSTRGRGNALRLALTGQLGSGADGFGDGETLATLDLCLSCKACKSECPSAVDMAKYKAEYLAQSYRRAGRGPWRVRWLGRIDLVNRVGSVLAPASNVLMGLPPVDALVRRVLHFSEKRELPSFASKSFRSWLGGYVQEVEKDAGVVVLYADCFTNYQEPGVARAGVLVLNALGYRVVAPRIGCCGRAAISQGMLGEATTMIGRAARGLLDAVEEFDAEAVIVCEPSCLASLQDEWLSLKVGGVMGVERKALERLSEMAFLPEEFLASGERLDGLGELLAKAGGGMRKGRVALHGHCHQRALGGVNLTEEVLRFVASGEEVEVLGATCCGMAGAFGYDAERYEVSMGVGELTLFPAVRELDEGAVVVAAGTSCRQQILAGTGVIALHPIEFVARQLNLVSVDDDG